MTFTVALGSVAGDPEKGIEWIREQTAKGNTVMIQIPPDSSFSDLDSPQSSILLHAVMALLNASRR